MTPAEIIVVFSILFFGSALAAWYYDVYICRGRK